MKVVKQETPKKFPAPSGMAMMISLSAMTVYQLARSVIPVRFKGVKDLRIIN